MKLSKGQLNALNKILSDYNGPTLFPTPEGVQARTMHILKDKGFIRHHSTQMVTYTTYGRFGKPPVKTKRYPVTYWERHDDFYELIKKHTNLID